MKVSSFLFCAYGQNTFCPRDFASSVWVLFFFICSLQLNSLSIVHGVRCRDKQRKESSRLQAVNRKLTAMNKLLMEENERLQKQVSQLVHENAYMKQQLQNVSLGFVNDKPYYNILLFVEVHTYLVAQGGSCLPLIPLYAACSLH